MGHDATQEAVVTVTATVRRLLPCAFHAARATGVQSYRNGKPFCNPNGYRHDCPTCASTPAQVETVEVED